MSAMILLGVDDTDDHSDIYNADNGQNDSSVEGAKADYWVNRNLFAESQIFN